MQKSSSSCQLQGRHQISSAHYSSPSNKQKSASTSTLHSSQRRNSYGGASKVNNHEPSSPVPRHGRSHLLASTYHPKHSLLTRGGGGGGRTGLTTESAGTTSSAGKQGAGYQGGGGSRSQRQPSKNNTSDLIVTSARIVSFAFFEIKFIGYLFLSPINNSFPCRDVPIRQFFL